MAAGAGAGAVVGVITAIAAAASAGAAVYSATQKPGAPKIPKPPLSKQQTNPDPDQGALVRQRKQAAAASLGRQGTLLTGPSGLGSTGSTTAPRSTLLGL